MQKNSSSNTIALIIGIALIVVIAILIFLKTTVSNKKQYQQNTEQQEIIATKLKKTPKISSEDFAKKIQNREKLNILDIRAENDFIQEHLFGSQNIKLSDFNETLKILDKNNSYVIIDNDTASKNAMLLVNTMLDANFKNVAYLDGGFTDWKNNSYPVISIGDPNSFSDQSKVNYIQSDDLKTLLQTNSDLIIIDVRKNAQFADGHLRNALNIPLSDLEKRKSDIPIGRKIIVYADNGLEAFMANVRLFDMGLFNTLALSDGLIEWKKKNYELIK